MGKTATDGDFDLEATDIFTDVLKEIQAFNALENDMTSHIHLYTTQATQNKAEKLLCKARELSKWAAILNEKISEHCKSKGLQVTDNISLNECSFSDKCISVVDECVKNEVPAVPLKKPLKIIPSIRQFSEKDLQSVPKYMKGRLTAKIINDFIEKLNAAIQIKYKILKKSKKLLTSHEKQYAIAFKGQETNLAKGNYFCIAEDMKVFCNYTFVNTSWSIITILRHCRLIKEIREPRLPVKYAIVEDN